jgi:hypothetical protein
MRLLCLRGDYLELKLFGSGFQLHRLDLIAILFKEQIRHEWLSLGILQGKHNVFTWPDATKFEMSLRVGCGGV